MLTLDLIDGQWVATVSWRSQRGGLEREQTVFAHRAEAPEWGQLRDREHGDAVRDELTVAQLVMGWHDERATRLRDTTVAREESVLMKHVARDPVGLQPARTVSRMDAHLFGERLKLKENGRGGLLAAKTRRHIQKAIRQAFEAAWEVESNPFARVPLPALDDREAAFLTMDEIERLLKNSHRHRWGWAFGVLVLTGMRRSELCGLRWQEVDLDGGFVDIKLRRTTARSRIVEGPPKTRRARRRIPLDPMAARLLRERAEERDEQRSAWGIDWVRRW